MTFHPFIITPMKYVRQSMRAVRSVAMSAFVFTVTTGPVLAQNQLENPIGVTDPNDLVANIIRTFLGVVGAIALLFFIYGGFLLLTSSGGQERVKKGRDTLMWATMGLIVIFGSYGITEAVFKAIDGAAL